MASTENGVEGYLDRIESGLILGWAWQSELPNEPISVDLYVDDKYELTTSATIYRPDLERAGKGNGRHAFKIKLSHRYHDGQRHLIGLRYHGTDLVLHGSPQSICLEAGTGFAYRVRSVQQRAELDDRARKWDQEKFRGKPKLSVIIPCYNLGEYLDEAVDSVLEQTYQNFEIIIVNDGSTDTFTNRLLENYSRPRVSVIQAENRGPGAARNAGIRIATGTYLCALDADDKLQPTYFEKAIKVLDENDSLTFVSCWVQTFGDEDWVWKQDFCDLPTLLGECTIATPALVRKAAVLAVGGYDESRTQWGIEDWVLWISLVEQGYRGIILPEVLFYYRKRHGSLSAFWMQGEGHLGKLRSVITRHRQSYRSHLIDVLLRKEGAICDLLRENDAVERHIHWLRQQIRSWNNEIERLREKLNHKGSHERLGSGVEELEPRVAKQSEEIQSLKIECDQLKRQRLDLETLLNNSERQMLIMRESRSWKITEPLRMLNAWLPLLTRWNSWTVK